MIYLLVEDFSVTVRCTGICKSPLTNKYQPLLSVVNMLIVTVKSLLAVTWMVTFVLSIDPDGPVTQDLPCRLSLHHLVSPKLLL